MPLWRRSPVTWSGEAVRGNKVVMMVLLLLLLLLTREVEARIATQRLYKW